MAKQDIDQIAQDLDRTIRPIAPSHHRTIAPSHHRTIARKYIQPEISAREKRREHAPAYRSTANSVARIDLFRSGTAGH